MELELLLAQTQTARDELQQKHEELLGAVAESEQMVAAVEALECKANERSSLPVACSAYSAACSAYSVATA